MASQANGGVYMAHGRSLFPVFVPDVVNNVQFAVTNGASARAALPITSPIIRVSSTGDIFLIFGNSAVDAATTSMPHAAGVEYYGIPDGATHIAAWGDGENSTVTVTPMDS